MQPPELAAWLASYRVRLRDALQQAARDGFHLLHATATEPDLDPRDLTPSAERHLARTVRDLGLRLDCLALPYPGRGLADPAAAEARVDALRRTLELCRTLGVPRAAVRLSGFEDDATRPLARELLGVVADLADRTGTSVALHGAPASLAAAAAPVRALQLPLVRLGLDTGQLGSDTPAIAPYADLLGSVHLRDVRRAGERMEEVPFGAGEVDFRDLLARLAGSDYAGPLVICRSPSAPVIDALRQGREYMAGLIERPGG